MAAINAAKARAVYDALEARPDLYALHAEPAARSMMNVAFGLRDPSLAGSFRQAWEGIGFSGLDGHRSLGGFRASLYNAVGLDAAENLAQFLQGWRG